MAIKPDDILILLGAGCSADASIPTAMQMVREIETLLDSKKERASLRPLYNYVKSAIIFGRGIQGQSDSTPNIEDLISVLAELEKKEKNIVFPFIANWNDLLLELAGPRFQSVTELKALIRENLRTWVRVNNYQQDAGYFAKFYEFQREWNYPLRVFTLNYDQCFEKLAPSDCNLELGFDETSKEWDFSRFEVDEKRPTDIYLYKLHGSINWKRQHGNLIHCDDIVDDPELIFGLIGKLQSLDPYLFYTYELRRYSLNCRLLIIIGYGFGDEHINDLLKQAIQLDSTRKLLCVTGPEEHDDAKRRVTAALSLANDSQLIIKPTKAKEYLQAEFTRSQIAQFLENDEEQPF